VKPYAANVFPLLFKLALILAERRRLRRISVLTMMVAVRVAQSPRGRRAVGRLSTMAASRVRQRLGRRRRRAKRLKSFVRR
jgi:hypothetical protein